MLSEEMILIPYAPPVAQVAEVKNMSNIDQNCFERIARQAEHAKANMGPGYGLDVTNMSDEAYLAHLRTKIVKRA